MTAQADDEKSRSGYVLEEVNNQDVKTDMNYKPKILWIALISHATMHILGLYGFYVGIYYAKWMTCLWTWVLMMCTGNAIIIGAHRGYSHRSFKISKAMQVFFVVFQTMAGQNSLFTWARDHRCHHKYSDTDADPHNANRGFIFAHVGWLVMTKHPLVHEKGRKVDFSDLKTDKAVMFQHKYFLPLYIVLGVFVPILVPMYGWNESFINSFLTAFCFRYVLVLNITWSINSFAHTFGSKSYDNRIRAVQSRLVWLVALGEGWHNFHHSFPWDYRSTDHGMQGLATRTIELLAFFGLLSDLKVASSKVVHGHAKRHGDGTHPTTENPKEPENLSNVIRLITMNTS